MENRITARQARAWMLGALGAPAAMALAGLGWTWVLLGGALVKLKGALFVLRYPPALAAAVPQQVQRARETLFRRFFKPCLRH